MSPHLVSIAIVATIIVVVVVVLLRRTLKQKRREHFAEVPFPEEWRQILIKDFALYEKLPESLRAQLHQRVQVFVDEKEFIGCEGLEVTDEMRVLVAAQACILILNRETNYYNGLHTIFLYPSAYVSNHARPDSIGVQHQSGDVRLGESWTAGPVVLSWCDVNRGAYNIHDGQNVTLHEFAHQLDQEDDNSDGTPILDDQKEYKGWAKAFKHDFVELRKKLSKGKKDILNSYAATDPAEFFAVATEVFFEKPALLAQRHPELFAELRDYYKVNPMDWD